MVAVTYPPCGTARFQHVMRLHEVGPTGCVGEGRSGMEEDWAGASGRRVTGSDHVLGGDVPQGRIGGM